MARGFNKVVLMGNLARDPEIRYTVDKRAWVRFTVAVGYSWKNKNGEIQNETDFIPVVVWGPRAETCARYLKKGSAVMVEGRIKVRSYEAKDGSGRKYSTDVAADDVLFVGPRRSSEVEEPGGMVSSGDRSPFGEDSDFGKSIREKGFGEDFPIDISEMGDVDGEPEVDIPF
jgi:single-strand DNA-binding protein